VRITSGGSVQVVITVVPQSVGTITNLTSVGSDYTDPVPANNTVSTTTTVLPLPVLSIRLLSGSRVRLSWAVELTNFVLEFKTNLVAASLWSSVTTAPVISGSERVVTETNTAPMRFYRLRD